MSDASIDNLRGIGPVTLSRLDDIGIRTLDDLQSMGSVEAYRRLTFMLPRQVRLDALYALEAALRDCHWLDLPQDVKAVLQHQGRIIDEALRRGGVTRCAL